MSTYDAIVVGARCAGSPTAMLLAREGYAVLLVDRAIFPSDTISTHLVHAPGVAALRRWGLLDEVLATGCPPIDTYAFDFGPFTITGSPGVAYGPRRTVLDEVLVRAAAAAGAELRERFTVTGLLVEDGRVTGVRGHGQGGGPVVERARVVIGADGLRSLVARGVRPERYHEKPRLLSGYYAYWSGLPMEGRFEAYVRPYRAFAAWPTNDGLTLVVGGWPYREHAANRTDVEGNFLAMLDMAPAFADRVRAGTRETRFAGMAVPNFFRTPYGPGWALVGDAGYNKDFITAQGIQDAFRDAELCVTAVDEAFSGARPFDLAMRDYRSARDAHVLPMYEFTADLASLDPPSPELRELLVAMCGNQQAMDGFARVNAGVTSPAEFFSDENVGRIVGAGPGSQF
ncbi:NAD(P)/FAD-dependent oxidoreductase [Pseudonocardia alaniniphila]|uniref:NAD(P)/FAD-dependent oxidoreductase n=1 Tax=Pseudonocardia alaniniphila TaxID=75291 RepID=A0ABS9TB54_9PSEU|nr:NAD(P)/FAD-dependent oxidoreductase [Pseudonocardia alaniniphila]MCH6165628.1 NAD(P)/FAD-dependent oxidoreductase [Pseudonocardia alaniniphila]